MVDVSHMIVYQNIMYFTNRFVFKPHDIRNMLFPDYPCCHCKGKGWRGIVFTAEMLVIS